MTPRECDDMVTYWLHSAQSAPHLLVRVVRERDLETCTALSVTPKDKNACVDVAIHRIYFLLHPCNTLDPAIAAKMLAIPCVPESIKDEFPITRDPGVVSPPVKMS